METNEKREFLAESPLFDNLLPPELNMLGDLFSAKNLSGGETVFEQGTVGNSLFVIARGDVEVLRDATSIAVLSAPQFFGEMSIIDKEYRSATVRAKSDVVLLELTNENLHTFAKHYRNGFTWVVVNIARVLSARLREVNKRLVAAN